MRIPLQQIGDDPFRWQVTLDLADRFSESSELLRMDPVEWAGLVTRVEAGFLLETSLATRLVLACDRCLKELEQEVKDRLSLLVLPQAGAPLAAELELEERDFGVLHIPEGEDLDSEPLLLEMLDLSLPMKPLCRDNCAGLCSECGLDRNDGECDCAASATDPRWSGLEGLKRRLAED
ncbi:MAG: DUF177 domain-containing protein [Acidobacteriota bacterium]